MEAPNEWTCTTLRESWKIVSEEIDGKWYPARPIGLGSILNRFQLAWAVFTGKADALFWRF